MSPQVLHGLSWTLVVLIIIRIIRIEITSIHKIKNNQTAESNNSNIAKMVGSFIAKNQVYKNDFHSDLKEVSDTDIEGGGWNFPFCLKTTIRCSNEQWTMNSEQFLALIIPPVHTDH